MRSGATWCCRDPRSAKTCPSCCAAMALRKRNLPSNNTPKAPTRSNRAAASKYQPADGREVRSSWGPSQPPPAQQVKVQVENRLAGAGADIEYRTVTVFDGSLAG